jgi:F-type H+-transporting ATPase subunit alpha
MKAFAQFGSDLDMATQEKLVQGARLMEVLKQGRFTPYPMEEECAILAIAIRGILMKCPVEKVHTFRLEFMDYLRTEHPKILPAIATTKELDLDLEHELVEAGEKFAENFLKRNPPKAQ